MNVLGLAGQRVKCPMINSLVQALPGDTEAHLAPASSSKPLPLSSSCSGRQVLLLVSEEQHGDTVASGGFGSWNWREESQTVCFSMCSSPADGSLPDHRASPSVCPAHSKDERARVIRVSVLNQGNKSLI